MREIGEGLPDKPKDQSMFEHTWVNSKNRTHARHANAGEDQRMNGRGSLSFLLTGAATLIPWHNIEPGISANVSESSLTESYSCGKRLVDVRKAFPHGEYLSHTMKAATK